MEYQLINEQNYDTLTQILINRGIKFENIHHYLNTTDDDILDPLLLDNLRPAAQMLFTHIKNMDKTCLLFDVDLDGYASGSALINYLYKLFPTFIKNKVMYQTNEGKKHGIILDTIPTDIKLLIVPDAGSNDIEQCKVLKEKGIDVLILDHHVCQDVNPYACVVNNQMCNYLTKSLCGAGVVYKFCQYIDNLLEVNYSDSILDLVALGLIGDVMDIRDFETKRLIDKGLAHPQNPFFTAMIEKQAFSLKGELTPIGIAFYIIPFVNAVVRMGTNNEKILVFESLLDFKGSEMIPSTKRGAKGESETRAEQACRLATNLKSHQQKDRDSALEIIETLIKEQNLLDHKVIAIKLDEEHSINRNLTGLIANVIMGKYKHPVLLLNKTIDELGIVRWEGSARNVGNTKFEDFRGFMETSGLVEYAQGHESAFGIGILDEKFDELMQYCDIQLASYDFSSCFKVDFIFEGTYLKPEEILNIANLNHLWGTNIEEPYIAIENIKVSNNVTLMSPDKNPTMKITLPNGISLIKFKSSAEEVNKLKSDNGLTNKITVVGRCASNTWNSITTAQIMIEDYEIEGQMYDF